MKSNHAEVLSAFFDGEAIEADTLAASLQEPDAIEYLVEFARLRRAVHEDADRPTEEFCEAMREDLSRADRGRRSRRRIVQLALAASLALAAALGGYTARGVLDRRHLPAGSGREAQVRPAPVPSADAQPVSAPARTERAAAVKRPKSAIPSPNVRIRFAEWREVGL